MVSKLAKAAYKGTSRAVKAYRTVKRVSKKTYRSTAKRVAAKVYKRPKTVPARSIKSSPRKESRSAAKVIRTTKKAKPKVAKRAQQPRRQTQTRIEKRAGNSNKAGNLDSLDPPKQKSLVKMDLQKFAGNKGTDEIDKVLTKNGAFRDAKRRAGIPNSTQQKKPVDVYDGTTENRRVYEFEVDGKKKYIIEHREDKFGRGPHFHGADDLKGSPLEKGRYNQYPGHSPEDFVGYKKKGRP
ncbi:HNH/endonuclease VII fold putative polymorphic toxin [Bacillus massilinigeriensis]|uniref:HNH/endonuclease VII fold putative polymorphic toxin n=2 Tax=Bacillus mediterraneensis TaxID=1805474 RepID=UPI0008F80F27|nr:HNH/endonuclease VII fold putative polymorphic toxin [Bacillus mediterraneensis]